MKTHILNKMKNADVEAYLDRGRDVIFILSLTGLPFFYPGATRTGRGTVYLSIAEGASYLRQLSDSLLKQGFRKQIYLSGHGPAYLTINSFIMDAFHDKKVPFVHISLFNAIEIAKNNGWQVTGIPFKELIYGAYKQMNQLDYLTVDPEAIQKEEPFSTTSKTPLKSAVQRLNSLATSPGNAGFFYEEFSDHGGGESCRSIAERDELALKGEKMIDEFIHFFHPQQVIDDLKQVDLATQEHIIPRYPHLK
ncbi:hypothetical protein RZO55_03925 [Clostridium boliviensis]|uniref:Creatinine amidohydrolase n=1 Tax=Clostridium boliviensis TaxID=318465 RepID=A0ABU4GIA5_9CLOT|nr:hypothetical protein [Clostridium boliviensis]MDW2796725.1 hypothetical protein [Clostridium boliviensis]